MSSSGGSVSDAPTNKTVSGQRHHLAYITPDEGKSLVDQGGVPTMTNEGVMAYPPLGEEGTSPGTRSDYTPGQGHRETVGGPPSISAGSAAQASTYTGISEEGKLGEGSTKDLTIKEHMANAPSLIKWSPTLSFLWGAGQNKQLACEHREL